MDDGRQGSKAGGGSVGMGARRARDSGAQVGGAVADPGMGIARGPEVGGPRSGFKRGARGAWRTTSDAVRRAST